MLTEDTKWALAGLGSVGLLFVPRLLKRVGVGAAVWAAAGATKVVTAMQNTGNTPWTYTIGCSIGRSLGGTEPNYTLDIVEKNFPTVTQTLDPGATSLDMTFDFSDVAPGLVAGTHYAIVKVYKEAALTTVLAGKYASWAVAEIVAAAIVKINVV